jgi:BirA family biotin operon repressor/biotin-[acetyl-CoA-carboxylase] ligase
MTRDALLLSLLRAAGDDSVSGEVLAARLGISRAAVWAHIRELRSLGYDIAASPHLGYRLLSAPDLLHADDLLSRLGESQLIGREIQVFRETTSTSDVVEKLARDGVAEGAVVFAESQTRGRGRLGRRWLSPAGAGLWLSVLLRPTCRPNEMTRLTIAAAVAVARAVREQTGLDPEVKWPNDLLLRGRKFAGILTELSGEQDRVRHAVLGIGVDVNLTAANLPADLRRQTTSLRLELGRPVLRAELAVALLRELDIVYGRLSAGQFEQLADEWESACTTLGREIEVAVGDRRLKGRAEALDQDGSLLLRTRYGRIERVTGGDVLLAAGT